MLLSSNGSASVNPGLSIIDVLPSSGYSQRHPYAKTLTVTVGYSSIISRGVASCIQSVSTLARARARVCVCVCVNS
jgi:hypothetical protein